jgi:hypothetical protein
MKKYFHSDGKEKHGPVSLDQLQQENIGKDTLIWFEGLDDWTPASEVEELRPILELRPPPLIAVESNVVLEKNLDVEVESVFPKAHSVWKELEKDREGEVESLAPPSPTNIGLKKASQGWIIAGFVFSVLGGWLGIVMGFNYAFGRYDQDTKTLGWVMAVVGFISIILWRTA